MATTPGVTEDLAANAVGIYQQAELTLLQKMAQAATPTDSDAAHVNRLTSFRRDAEGILDEARAHTTEVANVDRKYAEDYGRASARQELGKALPAGGAPDRVSALASLLDNNLRQANTHVVQSMHDHLDRAVLASAAAPLLGVESPKAASQRVLNDFARQGISTVVYNGQRTHPRVMRVESYVEMSMRTGLMNAALLGHEAELRADGERFVIVSDHSQECKTCREFEGKILSLDGDTGLQEEFGHTFVAYTSLKQARADGLFHPNCRHTFGAYIPGITEKPTQTADPEGDKARQQQRKLERDLRTLQRLDAASIDTNPALRRRITDKRAELGAHIDRAGLQRQRDRERMGFMRGDAHGAGVAERHPDLPGKVPDAARKYTDDAYLQMSKDEQRRERARRRAALKKQQDVQPVLPQPAPPVQLRRDFRTLEQRQQDEHEAALKRQAPDPPVTLRRPPKPVTNRGIPELKDDPEYLKLTDPKDKSKYRARRRAALKKQGTEQPSPAPAPKPTPVDAPKPVTVSQTTIRPEFKDVESSKFYGLKEDVVKTLTRREMVKIIANTRAKAKADKYYRPYAEIDIGQMTSKWERLTGNVFAPIKKPPMTDKPMPSWMAQAGTNPNISKGGTAWTQNCQRVISAYEMRRRGYQVSAGQRTKTNGLSLSAIARAWKLPDGTNPEWKRIPDNKPINNGADMVAVLQKMHPPGSRGSIFVQWKVGSSHVFNWERLEDGSIRFIEAQTNKPHDVVNVSHFSSHAADPDHFQIIRLDNAEPDWTTMQSQEVWKPQQ